MMAMIVSLVRLSALTLKFEQTEGTHTPIPQGTSMPRQSFFEWQLQFNHLPYRHQDQDRVNEDIDQTIDQDRDDEIDALSGFLACPSSPRQTRRQAAE